MARYRCPYCHPRPLRVRPGSDGQLLCGHCGDPLLRVPLLRPGAALAGVLVLAGLGLTVVAQHLELLRSVPPLPERQAQTQTQRQPPLEGTVLAPGQTDTLFALLEAGDRSWLPRAEPLPGGGTRYVYQRRAGDPALSVAEVKALLRDPPTFSEERRTIAQLLEALHDRGVTVLLAPPLRSGAAGEWEPRTALLRIRPDVPSKGSREFARVLNHEVIHVAQSCRGGPQVGRLALLGLPRQGDGLGSNHLQDPVYARASAHERTLEQEAYANQDQLQLGLELLELHCPTAPSVSR